MVCFRLVWMVCEIVHFLSNKHNIEAPIHIRAKLWPTTANDELNEDGYLLLIQIQHLFHSLRMQWFAPKHFISHWDKWRGGGIRYTKMAAEGTNSRALREIRRLFVAQFCLIISHQIGLSGINHFGCFFSLLDARFHFLSAIGQFTSDDVNKRFVSLKQVNQWIWCAAKKARQKTVSSVAFIS